MLKNAKFLLLSPVWRSIEPPKPDAEQVAKRRREVLKAKIDSLAQIIQERAKVLALIMSRPAMIGNWYMREPETWAIANPSGAP